MAPLTLEAWLAIIIIVDMISYFVGSALLDKCKNNYTKAIYGQRMRESDVGFEYRYSGNAFDVKASCVEFISPERG